MYGWSDKRRAKLGPKRRTRLLQMVGARRCIRRILPPSIRSTKCAAKWLSCGTAHRSSAQWVQAYIVSPFWIRFSLHLVGPTLTQARLLLVPSLSSAASRTLPFPFPPRSFNAIEPLKDPLHSITIICPGREVSPSVRSKIQNLPEGVKLTIRSRDSGAANLKPKVCEYDCAQGDSSSLSLA